MSRTRSNAKTGDIVDLYAFFYKNGELTEPSSVGNIEIIKRGSTIASVLSDSIISYGNGIKRVSFDVPVEYSKDVYYDKWKDIVYESGVESESKVLSFTVRQSEWETDSFFEVYRPSLYAKTEFNKIKLNEKKWLKFSIKDGNGYLNNTDKVNIIMKDHDGSGVYIIDSCVNSAMEAYYFMNSSALRASYPDYINRTASYDFVLQVHYNDQVYVLDPLEFDFSE